MQQQPWTDREGSHQQADDDKPAIRLVPADPRQQADGSGENNRLEDDQCGAAAQMVDLAGVDVYTLPPKVAQEFLASAPPPEQITAQLDRNFETKLNPGVDPERIAILWTIDDKIYALTRFAETAESRSPSS